MWPLARHEPRAPRAASLPARGGRLLRKTSRRRPPRARGSARARTARDTRHPGRRLARAGVEHVPPQRGPRRVHRPAGDGLGRRPVLAARVAARSLRRLGRSQLPPQYGAPRRGLALEPERHLERRQPRIFHRCGGSRRADPPFVRIPAAPARVHPQRGHGERRILAPHRRRRALVLEEQPVPRARVHRGERWRFSPVDRHRPRSAARGGCDPDLVGGALREELQNPVLDRRRGHQETGRGRVERLSDRQHPEGERRRCDAPAVPLAPGRALRADRDGRVLRDLRSPPGRGSPQLRRVRHLRGHARDARAQERLSRSRAPRAEPGPDDDLLLVGGPLASAWRHRPEPRRADRVRSLLHERSHARPPGHDSGRGALRHARGRLGRDRVRRKARVPPLVRRAR